LGSRLVAAVAYPVLRMGRNAALFLLGRTRMRAISATAQAPWLLFHQVLGVFALLHTLIYAFHFRLTMYPSTWLIGSLGAGPAAAAGVQAPRRRAAADVRSGRLGPTAGAFEPYGHQELPAAGNGGLRPAPDVARRRLDRVLQRLRPHRPRAAGLDVRLRR